MNLAILHYHLNRGGVTRVVANQLMALDAALAPGQTVPLALVYGGRRMGWPEDLPERLRTIRLSLHPLPPLDYDERHQHDPTSPNQHDPTSPDLDHPTSPNLDGQLADLLDQLEFAPQETVVHVHNHAIGKNVGLPPSVWRLAERGYALLLQLHDFVEDYRPANFRRLARAMAEGASSTSWHGRLYPQAPHVQYAVLNGRDHEVLRAAGVDEERLHLLPNPVPKPEQLPPRGEARRRLAEQFGVHGDDRFVLYPVRCIRRKNVGEALLYGQLGPRGTIVGLTLPPLNPAERSVYATWKQLSDELGLPARFEVGAPGALSFIENLAASDLILTTSVAEGFGMVFLESWLAGRSLVGRDLPEITSDFTEVGLRFDRLRPHLWVPVDWVGAGAFRQTVQDAYRRSLAAFDRPEPPRLAEGLDAKTPNGLVDFADLDEPFQEQVIRRVGQSDRDRLGLLEGNRWIDRALAAGTDDTAPWIRQNVEVIDRHFSLVPSGRRLLAVYQRAVASARGERLEPLRHPDRILDRFLSLERFRLIRSEPVRTG